MLALVSDSSPLIYLTRLGCLSLLWELHERVFVPQAVWSEITVGGEGLPEAVALRAAVVAGSVQVVALSSGTAASGDAAERLGRADVEAVLLARELGAVLLADDLEVRELARRLAVEVTGTIGLLLRAKRAKRIHRLKPLLDQLLTQTNFRMSASLLQAALSDAGEA